MRTQIRAFLLIGMLVVAPLCFAQSDSRHSTMEELREDTQELLQSIGSYTADRRDEAVQQAQEGLEALDQRIEALEARIDQNWDEMSMAARANARETLRALRSQRNQVAEWYGSMKTSSADAWDHVKNGFSDAYQNLSDAWEESEEEFAGQ